MNKVTFGSLNIGDKFKTISDSVSVKSGTRECYEEGREDWRNSITPSLKVTPVEDKK
jgi:hypothetical protein